MRYSTTNIISTLHTPYVTTRFHICKVMLYCQPYYCFNRKFLDGTFFCKKSSCVVRQSFVPVALRKCQGTYISLPYICNCLYFYSSTQHSRYYPILFRSKYVIIRDCIPDPWSERYKKIDTRMYAWMHFVLQVAHIIEKGVSQFKRTERYSDYVYECSYDMDVDSGI